MGMKVVQLKAHASTARAEAVRALLKDREKAEVEIATLLREELNDLGEAKWLAWCDREFGWSRSTAYKHLNTEQVGRERARAAEHRRKQRPYGTDIDGNTDGGIEDEIDGEDPENYRTAYLLRAEQAIRFAVYSGPITPEIVATARAVVVAWTHLARKLEKGS